MSETASSSSAEPFKKDLLDDLPVIVSIESNIGAGKTAILEYLNEKYENEIATVQENVKSWCELGKKSNVNALRDMYDDPKTNFVPFQFVVQGRRYKDVMKQYINCNRPILLVERDIRSGPMIFGLMQYQQGNINYLSYLSLIQATNCLYMPMAAKLLVYIESDVDLLMERINKRNRPEESNIGRDTLSELNRVHDKVMKGYGYTKDGQLYYNHRLGAHVICIQAKKEKTVTQIGDEVYEIVKQYYRQMLIEGRRHPYVFGARAVANEMVKSGLWDKENHELCKE